MNDLFNDPAACVLAPFDPSRLDAGFIAQHVREGIGEEEWAGATLTAVELQMGKALLTASATALNYPAVQVQLAGDQLALACTCNMTLPYALCAHQARALYTIAYKDEYRLFFDPVIRQRMLRSYAAPYGLQDDPLLDTHFNIAYEKQQLQVKPRQAGLFAVTPEITHDLKALLLPGPETLHPIPPRPPNHDQLFVVLHRHKYYKQLCTELYTAGTTATDKLKNPLQAFAPHSLAWGSDRAEELKFYNALAKFQHNIATHTSATDLEGLKAIARNPLGLRFYVHNSRSSENIVAGALEAITLGSFIQDLRIHVAWQEPFYHIHASLLVDGMPYLLRDVKMKFDYFVQLDHTLHLVMHFPYLKVMDFFRRHGHEISIHGSKFALFQQEVLSKLEDFIRIQYPPGVAPVQDTPLPSREWLLYLSDLDNYILLTPVIRYGNVEIPVRTKRVLYTPGDHGRAQTFHRDNSSESAFMALLTRQHKDFPGQLENSLPHFYIPRLEFLEQDWFLDAFENWRANGITVMGFSQLKNIAFHSHKAKIAIRVTSGINWFNTAVHVTFDKHRASLQQLHKAVRNRSRFVQLDDGSVGILPEAWISRFARYFDAGTIVDENILTAKVNFSAIADLYDAANLDENVQQELDKYHHFLHDTSLLENVPVPEGFQGQLRNYQQQGLNWLNFLDDLHFGGCLADDMGLGKSVQILAFILLQRKKVMQQTNLLVVPTSLVFNWEAERCKFAPSIKTLIHYGPQRERTPQDFSQFELVITTYGTLVADIHYLRKFIFNYIFLDESQLIKNPDSQRYKAARLLQARNRIVITGTPIENSTFDLYGQLSFACPGLLGSKQFFKDVYAFPIDKFKDSEHAAILQRKVAPFILRRTKEQVAAELPGKTEMLLFCPMGDEQWQVYQQYEKEFRDFLEGIRSEDLSKNALHILSSLTKLRQICNSPLLLKEEKLYGEGAAKIDMLLKQITSKSTRHKILVFSQFVGMLELVANALQEKHIPYAMLTGSTRNREEVVQAFQEGDEVRVFLASLKAGGVGLNLTAADYVYLADPWWNPAVENQAIDRVYRIGQTRNVVAVRLICPGTIEEKLLKMQEHKKDLAGSVIKSDGEWLQTMSKSALLQLVGR